MKRYIAAIIVAATILTLLFFELPPKGRGQLEETADLYLRPSWTTGVKGFITLRIDEEVLNLAYKCGFNIIVFNDSEGVQPPQLCGLRTIFLIHASKLTREEIPEGVDGLLILWDSSPPVETIENLTCIFEIVMAFSKVPRQLYGYPVVPCATNTNCKDAVLIINHIDAGILEYAATSMLGFILNTSLKDIRDNQLLLRILAGPKPTLNLSMVSVQFYECLRNDAGPVDNLTFYMPLPRVDDRQAVVWIEVSGEANGTPINVKIESVLTDDWGNNYAKIRITSFPGNSIVCVNLTCKVLVRHLSYDFLEYYNFTVPERYPESVSVFLNSSLNVESDHPELMEKAWNISAGLDNPLEIARSFALYVARNVMPVTLKPWEGASALKTLREGWGLCVRRSYLLVGLLRSRGVPARLLWVVPASPDGESCYTHCIPIAYLYPYGWVPIEPIYGVVPETVHTVPSGSIYVYYWLGSLKDESISRSSGLVWPFHKPREAFKCSYKGITPVEPVFSDRRYKPGQYGVILKRFTSCVAWWKLAKISRLLLQTVGSEEFKSLEGYFSLIKDLDEADNPGHLVEEVYLLLYGCQGISLGDMNVSMTAAIRNGIILPATR